MAQVLIVEDDQAMAVALRDGFAYEGYEVELATDGAAGLRAAMEGHFDLMILDVMMPRKNGAQFLNNDENIAQLDCMV